MSEMEENLGAILSNPQIMQQIMALAQSMGAGSTESKPQPPPESAASHIIPDMDPRMLQKVASLLKQSGVDRNQTALLSALSPYLSRDRITRLERAMQAARMAGAASSFLSAGGLQMLGGR